MDPQRPSSKACHNCRYSRLRCDRSVPACRKCTNTGKECLGYGKLYRWAGAVASRGKLAGNKLPVLNNSTCLAEGPTTKYKSTATRDAVVSANTRLCHSRAQASAYSSPDNQEVPWVLVDPLFQDINTVERQYLSYFTTRLCPDLVAIDLPGQNPFHELVPLSGAHSLLRHIVIAASATHMSNFLKPRVYTQFCQPQSASHHALAASRRAAADALTAKQRGLEALRLAIEESDPLKSGILLAAAHFFIALELIESGKHGWRAHLEGSGNVLKHLQPGGYSNKMLRDFIIADCYISYIFASTVVNGLLTSSSYFHTAQAPSVIRFASNNSYICCPAEILQILMAVARLSNEQDDDGVSNASITEAGMEHMNNAMSYDLDTWARDIKNVPHGRQVTEIQSRTHAGRAHQLACCLYILYAVPSIRDHLPADTEQTLEQDLFLQLLSIPDGDPSFKTSPWPTFIAGAQARDPERQAWSNME
ncbi:hypothetical protein CEP53_005495 [Fusarium sp. AF-6]|nr:hypothetical protein CEP53_005495 [Fusarium sp. AF-6]